MADCGNHLKKCIVLTEHISSKGRLQGKTLYRPIEKHRVGYQCIVLHMYIGYLVHLRSPEGLHCSKERTCKRVENVISSFQGAQYLYIQCLAKVFTPSWKFSYFVALQPVIFLFVIFFSPISWYPIVLVATILSYRYNSHTGSGETKVESHASSDTQPYQEALLLKTARIQSGSQPHQCVGGNTVHLATLVSAHCAWPATGVAGMSYRPSPP